MNIHIEDHRNVKEAPKGIHWTEAKPGRLYQTLGSREDRVIMAVLVPGLQYTRAFPDSNNRAFVNVDGRAFPETTERLMPLKGHVTWTVTGEDE